MDYGTIATLSSGLATEGKYTHLTKENFKLGHASYLQVKLIVCLEMLNIP